MNNEALRERFLSKFQADPNPEVLSAALDKGDWAAALAAERDALIHRQADGFRYTVRVDAPGASLTQSGPHRIRIAAAQGVLEMALTFAREDQPAAVSPADALSRCTAWWAGFWNKGGAIDLAAAADPRAMELERRMVLSLYLLTVNSSGHMPPAETGLTCNSWYGKAHLEMHFWHMAWAPLWGCTLA